MSAAAVSVEIVSTVRDRRVRSARSFPNRPPAPNRRKTPSRYRRRTHWAVKALIIFAIAVAVLVGSSLLASKGALPGADPTPTATLSAPATLPASPPTTVASGSVADPAAAIVALDALLTADGFGAPDYDRDHFGRRWADVDRNGCDTRNDMLGRDLTAPSFKPGTRECKVLAGTLTDPYSGVTIDFVSGPDTSPRVQIDHIVALAWAWRQGAHEWSPEQREAFANDPRNLRAAGEATNQAKSDSGPSGWLPPAPDLQCRFVLEWVSVVVDYDLSINARDRAAAQQVLHACPTA